MIDPSSSEEESDEDQGVHQGAGSRGRGGPPHQQAAASGAGHGSRYHAAGGPAGPVGGSTGMSGVGSAGAGGGPAGGGSPGLGALPTGAGTHGRATAKAGLSTAESEVAAQAQVNQANQAGLDLPGNHMTSARNSLSPSMSAHQEAVNYVSKTGQRPTSPSPSVASEKTEQEMQVITFLNVCVRRLRFKWNFGFIPIPIPIPFIYAYQINHVLWTLLRFIGISDL
jgi:hypothetical protein